MDVCAQWFHLGLQLKVRTGTLHRIKAQFTDPRDQLAEMLETWLNSGDNTSWKTLTDALRSQSVEKGRLAGILEKKYCSVEETNIDKGIYVDASDSFQFKTNVLQLYP